MVGHASSFERRWIRAVVALAAPFAAFAIETLLWRYVEPNVWFLFYAAVFVSSWLGGVGHGLLATAISTALIASQFEARVLPTAIFWATGTLFAVFHARVRRVNEQLKRTLAERQIFAALVENSSDFIGIADVHGKPVYVNPAGRRMVGLAADRDLSTTQIPEYYPPEHRDHAANEIVRGMIEDGLWKGETYFRNWTTNAAIPVSDTHFMIRAPVTGELLGMGTITRDISERRRLEDDLRLSEARSSGILSISADAIISIDDDQRITMFNEGAEAIFGYPRGEVIGMPLDRLIPQRLRAAHREHVARFASGELVARRMGERSSAVVGLRKNGEEFPASASISKLAVGGTRVLTVSLRDMTDEKRVEAEHAFFAEVGAVLSSTLDYEKTLANLAELAVRDFADFCIVDMIRQGGEIQRLEVACRAPADAWICDVLSRVPIDPHRPYMTGSVLQTKQPALLEHVSAGMIASFAQNDEHHAALRAMGARSVILVPVVARGLLLGAIGLVSARSSRTYSQDDVRVAEELARRAALSIDNARLYRAAQRAIQLRDEVLGVVAHDLRNPLNSILLQAELVKQRGTASQSNHADAIRGSAVRMNRLIQDLLDVARMESGHLSVVRARVHPIELLAACVEVQQALAAAESIEIVLDVSPDVPDVSVDRDRLLQILENLIGNACKFTPAGGRVTIGAAPRGGEVLFWVADTGTGISPEHQKHVFDRFWQTDDARRRGAGLGLPIVKGLVEAHGGEIWVESTPGRGSTFFFTLPAEPAELARDQLPNAL